MIQHALVDLRFLLDMSDRKLERALKKAPDGAKMSAEDIRAVLRAFLAAGMDTLPMCDHCDARGRCMGHPAEEEAEVLR